MQTEPKAMRGKVLAFDTSNYTTSVAVTDLDGRILTDVRRILDVKAGERGLRQSHALFQHIENLPDLVRRAVDGAEAAGGICATAASDRPRPVEGSYMPVFRAGVAAAESIAAALGVPCYRFSHQEGHIAAVCGALDPSIRTVSFHLSGGTGELIRTEGCRPLEIIGGVKDLSFGQLIDRTGVALGYGFPAGAALDEIALRGVPAGGFSYSSRGNTKLDEPVTSPIRVKETYANLSGIETQMMRAVEAEKRKALPAEISGQRKTALITELFCRISDALLRLCVGAANLADTDTIVFVGGVSSSRFIRSQLETRLSAAGIRAIFGDPQLSSDNASGIARLAMAQYTKENR